MKFNETRAKESAIDTGAAVAGAVASLALINKASALAADKAPSVARHVPAIALATLIALQAFDVVPNNPMIDSAIQGASVVGGMQVVREYSGANTAAGRTATSGLAALINQYVPDFDTTGTTTAAVAAATTTQAAITAGAVNGLRGLGSLAPYRDPAEAMRLSGEYARQSSPLQSLGSAPTEVGGLKTLG